MPLPPASVYRARYVLPIDRPPIGDGVVVVAGDRIAEVRQRRAGEAVIDLGDVALLPGLVNAHTHLEFSDLAEPIAADRGFSRWIGRVIEQRRSMPASAATITHGLAESAASGVTLLGEISTTPRPIDAQSFADVTIFHEVLGLSPEVIDERFAGVQQRMTAGKQFATDHLQGISPHAPYSVHPRLLELIVGFARARECPLAMHLAESLEEIELLRGGTGPLVDFFEEFGFWRPDAIPPERSPLDYLRLLSQAPRALVVHGNYLNAEEIDFLATHSQRMSVVYCARTHTHFAHAAYPLAEMLQAGVVVALGTDSRASNPDLNLWRDAQYAGAAHPDVSPEHILHAATLGGAAALGRAQSQGSITPGKLANLATIAIDANLGVPANNSAAVATALLASDASVVHRMIRGRWTN